MPGPIEMKHLPIRPLFLLTLLSANLYAIDSDRDTLPDDWELANDRNRNSADYQISTGWEHTCALDDDGVKCWGRNDYGLTEVPELSNPVQVSVGASHNCVIDDAGVQYWGDNSNGQTDVLPLDNPRQVSLGRDLRCWR